MRSRAAAATAACRAARIFAASGECAADELDEEGFVVPLEPVVSSPAKLARPVLNAIDKPINTAPAVRYRMAGIIPPPLRLPVANLSPAHRASDSFPPEAD